MRSMTLLAVFPLLIMTPALAQDQPSSSSGNTQAIQQQVQNNLKQAGFTDIQIMPSSWVRRVRAHETRAPVIVAPRMRGRRSRATVSTSGSSGIDVT